MHYGAALPLHARARFAEGSRLASVRDNRNVSLQWKQNQNTAGQVEAVVQQLQKTVRQLSKQRRRIVGGGVTGAQAVQCFQLVSDGGDWYNCYTFDGLNVGATIIKVAKNQDLRCILPTASPAGGAWASRVKRGTLYNYTYNAIAGATSDGVNVVEYQRAVVQPSNTANNCTSYIVPFLNIGDIITAEAATFAGPATLVGVQWLAWADGRAWTDPT